MTSLGDNLPDPRTGRCLSQPERHRQIVELAVEAEAMGARSVHLGEHHFCDYIVSAPELLLATIASRTRTLRLSTAVTLVAHHDPVMLAEQWATLDVLSDGRAEMIVGRGVVAGLYEQFGQDHAVSREIVAERIDLVRRLFTGTPVTWTGAHRAPVRDITLAPRPVQPGGPPLWLSVSSADSVAEAVRLGCAVALPLVSTGMDEGAALCRRYRREWSEAGHDPASAFVAVNVHCHVSDRPDARDHWAPYQFDYLRWVVQLVAGRALPLDAVRPFWATLEPPVAQAVCGSPAEVAERLGAFATAAGGVDLWLYQGDQGGLPHDEIMDSMTRFAHQVIPTLHG